MSLVDLLVQPVLVISQHLDGDLDEYGNDVPSDEPVSTVGFLSRARRMGMTQAEREGYVEESAWLLVLLPDTPIQAEDLVIVDGITYSVSGPPWHAFNPNQGVVDHIEVTVIRTAGALEAGS